jgi:hypothetical protein
MTGTGRYSRRFFLDRMHETEYKMSEVEPDLKGEVS